MEWYQMEWYQIVATVYTVGFIVSFLMHWLGLLYIDEDPRESAIFIAVKSLGWMYFLPAFLGTMTTQRRFLSASEKIEIKNQEEGVRIEKEKKEGSRTQKL